MTPLNWANASLDEGSTCSDDFIVEGPKGIMTAEEYIATVKVDLLDSSVEQTEGEK